MNVEELKAVLDIVNKEIAEEGKTRYFTPGHFSMNNPEKSEWIKRLKRDGVIVK